MHFCLDIICDMKKILSLLIVSLVLPSFSFGYLETSLFCSVNDQQIKVSLKDPNGSKCKSYIVYIEQTMRQAARDIYTIQGYINKWHDIEYWKNIKTEKLSKIDKLQVIRLNIIASMKTFESNLLKKSLEYFMLKVTPYKIQLIKWSAKLAALPGTVTPELQRYMTIISGQIQTIDKIGQSKTFEELIPLLKGYIYFKQQIEWKSE